MVTLYQLLGVDENASKEIIKNAYEARLGHSALDDKRKNQLRIAAEILLDDAKREKYNQDLSNYRAQELLKKVEVPEEPKTDYNALLNSVQNENNKKEEVVEENVVQNKEEKNTIDVEEDDDNSGEIYNDIFNALEDNKLRDDGQEKVEEQHYTTMSEKERELRDIENRVNEEEYRKILKKQEVLDRKERKKAEKEYKEKYTEAYITELRNRGYNVKYPWTWKRVRNLLIGIVSLIIICFILWQIPAVKESLIKLYNENFIIKAIVDIIKSFLQVIGGAFESN